MHVYDDTVLQRFWKYVNKTKDGCWLWTAAIDPETGYGRLSIAGKSRSAHRLSYEIHYGFIPIGLCVLHRCDVRRCVRPDHFFLGTRNDNMQDLLKKKGHWQSYKPECAFRGNRNELRASRENVVPSKKRPSAKLNDKQIEQARHWFQEEHWTMKRIAQHLEVTPPTISRMLNRKTYKNAP